MTTGEPCFACGAEADAVATNADFAIRFVCSRCAETPDVRRAFGATMTVMRLRPAPMPSFPERDAAAALDDLLALSKRSGPPGAHAPSDPPVDRLHSDD